MNFSGGSIHCFEGHFVFKADLDFSRWVVGWMVGWVGWMVGRMGGWVAGKADIIINSA